MPIIKECAVDVVIAGVNHHEQPAQQLIEHMQLEIQGRIQCQRYGNCALQVDKDGNFIASPCIERGYDLAVLIDQKLQGKDI